MSSERLIADELLAFIQHTIDKKDEVSIVEICKSSFTEDEICRSKVLLYETLGQADRMSSRRRDEKGERSLQDIINLLKTTDPDHVPAFVAKQLHKLPRVTFDHVDVTRLKDITTVKDGLAEVQLKLELTESAVSGLRAELLSLKDSNSVNRSPKISNVNVNVSISSFSPPQAFVEVSCACNTPRAPPAPTAPPAPAAPWVTSGPSAAGSTLRAYTAAAAAPAAQPVSTHNRPSNRRSSAAKQAPLPSRCNLFGTATNGPNHQLRPSIPTTPLYVSRLHWSTKVADVVDYVLQKSNFSLRVERLVAHHGANFNSYVVRVPTHHLPTFMKEDFWPPGVVFRKYRGRLPADTAYTPATLRVN